MSMHLTLSPQAGQPGTIIAVVGDVLRIDGAPHDLSPVPEGGDGEWPHNPLLGRITRLGGVIHAGVVVELDHTAAEHQPADPAHWTIHATDGAVTIPAVRRAAAAEAPGRAQWRTPGPGGVVWPAARKPKARAAARGAARANACRLVRR